MKTIKICNSGHLIRVLEDLIRYGWCIESIPMDGKLPRNGLNLILKLPGKVLKLRIFAYKVTTSGRSRPHERRVEITTTYLSGLAPAPEYCDIVLGVDVASGKYVGIDNTRLGMGGKTHNASSFFDLEGLSVDKRALLINPRSVATAVFPRGIEYHVFCDGSRLAEYLFNHRTMHSGRYTPGTVSTIRCLSDAKVSHAITQEYPTQGNTFVLFTHVKKQRLTDRISGALVNAVESRDFSGVRTRKITPEQLQKLLSLCAETGSLGEQAVLIHERKRLEKLGLKAQAEQVERVSLRSVGEGYDILSFEDDGVTKRYLEVKSTIGEGNVVDMSVGEWKAAKRYGAHYYLVRVIRVKISPQLFFVPNPVQLESEGKVKRTPTGWKVDLQQVMTRLK